MIFDKIPYSPEQADDWDALGHEFKEYYLQFADNVIDLMVAGTNNAHIGDAILAADGINRFQGGFSCDQSCLLPMATLSAELGGEALAEVAWETYQTIQSHSNWTAQEIDDYIHNNLLVTKWKEIVERTRVSNKIHGDFGRNFASWLETDFPRIEVADTRSYVLQKWKQVKDVYPEIWRGKQIDLLDTQINGEVAFSLLNQCGFQGIQKMRHPEWAAVTAPIYWVWVKALEGDELMLVRFADAVSLIDMATWHELARSPSIAPRNGNNQWLATQRKQFMIDRDTFSILEPKFFRPLPKKLVYMQ